MKYKNVSLVRQHEHNHLVGLSFTGFVVGFVFVTVTSKATVSVVTPHISKGCGSELGPWVVGNRINTQTNK